MPQTLEQAKITETLARYLGSTPTWDKIRDPDLSDPDDLANFGNLVEGFATRKTAAGRVKFKMAQMYFSIDWKTCVACGRTWAKLVEGTGGECIACVEARAAEEVLQRKLGDYLRLSIGHYGIENYRFDNFRVSPMNDRAFEAFKTFDWKRNNLFVYGPCGTGKTHLAGATFKRLCGQSLTVKWATPFYINRIFRKLEGNQEESQLQQFGHYDGLVIDDLGVGRETDFTLRIIYEILAERIKNERNGLIITSNLALDKLAKHFGDDRLTSRIAGLCNVIYVNGPDSRLG
jgi:DNA replication protein DnaC